MPICTLSFIFRRKCTDSPSNMSVFCTNSLLCLGSTCLIFASVVYYLMRYHLCRKVPVKGKVVLITGASAGLGEACARVFHDAGCKVLLCGRRTHELERVKRSLQESHSQMREIEPVVVALDMSKPDELGAIIDDIINSCGPIDILINNAGISSTGSLLDTDLEVYRRVMEVNFFGQIIVTKAIVKNMVNNNGGSVVAVSSLQGRFALPNKSPYASSKHALQAMCDSLRAEVHDKNIHVCVVSPSYIKTDISYQTLHADGTEHGKMDPEIDTGMSGKYVADKILECVQYRYDEILLGPFTHQLAVFARCLCSTLFFRLMNARARSDAAA